MDQRDLQLTFDYTSQAANMLRNQERIFLDASEPHGDKALEGIQRLVFLFKRLARAVGHKNIFDFFEEVEGFLSYCQERYETLVAKDKEIFVELYDHMSVCFEQLKSDPEARLDHQELFYGFEQVKRSVELKTKSLSFTIGSKEKKDFDKERFEILQLAQDLDVLQRGAGSGEFGSVSLKHLRSISHRLLALGRAVNLQKMSDLFFKLSKDFRRKNLRFGFYGGEHAIDRKALGLLAPAVEELLENAFFHSELEKAEAFLKASKTSLGGRGENVRLEVQLAMAQVKDEVLASVELELESKGFQVLAIRDEYSGTSVSIDIPKTVNSIEGQVVELDGQSYAIDLRYVKDCVKLSNDNVIDLKKKAVYLNHKGACAPMLNLRDTLGLETKDFAGGYALLLEMRGEKAALIVDSVGRRQTLSLRSLRKGMPRHRYFKSVCFLESSLPVFLLDGKKIIQDQRANEFRLRKFLEVSATTSAGEVSAAIDSKDIKEIAPYEKVTVVPGAQEGALAMMNYQGEPIMVYSLFEMLGVQKVQGPRNIVICENGKSKKGEKSEFFGLAVGERISIKTLTIEECYDRPAMAGVVNSKFTKGAYYHEEKETVVIDPQKVISPEECGQSHAGPNVYRLESAKKVA